MADKDDTSQHKGSDLVHDVCCSVCADDGLHIEGRLYCEKCSKYFCDSCVLLHNRLHKNHPVLAKGEDSKWPEASPTAGVTVDVLEMCEEHSNAKLDMFCDDHQKLFCNVCLLNSHRQCRLVVLISDKVKSSTWDLKKTIAEGESLRKGLDKMQFEKEQNILVLKASFKRDLQEIGERHQKVIETFDRLHNNLKKELETVHTDMLASLQSDIENCQDTRKMMIVTDDIPQAMPERGFILYRKCIEQNCLAETKLQELTINANVEISLQPNEAIDTFISTCSRLGTFKKCIKQTKTVDPNQVLVIHDKGIINVKMDDDSNMCLISGMCETSDMRLIIADTDNYRVKLLDHAFKVKSCLTFSAWTWSLCRMSSDEVAVTVCDSKSLSEIHVFRVQNETLVALRTIKVKHHCYHIAHHKDDLYLTSRTTLYHYSQEGQCVRKLYINKTNSGFPGVAVSPDGQRIFVTDADSEKLLTLTRDGAVTATLQDPALKCLEKFCNICVTNVGHVFVFGETSISQVDMDGKKILTTLHDNGFKSITSVFLSVDKKQLFVAMRKSNFLVFKASK